MSATSTHRLYDSVGHSHLDAIEHGGGGLLVVELRNGTYYLEVDHGNFPRIDGVVQHSRDLETSPIFYESELDAHRAGLDAIRKSYPDVPDEWFLQQTLE